MLHFSSISFQLLLPATSTGTNRSMYCGINHTALTYPLRRTGKCCSPVLWQYKAREVWIRRVAMEGEAVVKDGRTRWESIKKRPQAETGCRLVRPSGVKKEDGELPQGSSELLQRWYQHFSRLLN